MAQIQARSGGMIAHNVFPHTRGERDSRRRRRSTLVGIAIVVALVVALGGLLFARVQDNATAQSPSIVTGASVNQAAFEAYAPGSSVYEQQVSAQAVGTDLAAFTPGGSVYDGQVPSQAIGADLSAFTPGGSVYEQQVP